MEANDYYPFGQVMPSRTYLLGSKKFRWGYNAGSENDNDVSPADGGLISTYYREGDTRVVMWYSIDPKPSPSWSPYTFMDDNPIWICDPMGDIGIKEFFRGVNNLLHGRSWDARYTRSYIKQKTGPQEDWVYIRKNNGNLVHQSYIDQLQQKVDKYNSGNNEYAWADRLFKKIDKSITHELSVRDKKGQVFDNEKDFKDNQHRPLNTFENVFMPKYLDVDQVDFMPKKGRSKYTSLDLSINNNQIQSFGYDPPEHNLFDVKSNDLVTLSYSRIQPQYGDYFKPIGKLSGDRYSKLPELRIGADFAYKIRVRLK